MGQRIHREVLGSQRANYGNEIVSTLSRQLSSEFGRGFSSQNLRHMIRFAQAFSDEAIVSKPVETVELVALEGVDLPGRSAQARLLRRSVQAGDLEERIELLELDKSGIHVAEYLTVLPPREAMQAKLQQSIANARQRLQQASADKPHRQDEPEA